MATDKKNDYLRVDATAEMTRDLDKRFNDMFPILSETGTGIKRDQLKKGEVAHVSVIIPKDWKTNPEFHQNLITLLEVAKDPSHPAYSRHGSRKHQTYDEAIDILIDNVRQGTFDLNIQPVKKRVGNMDITASRLILQPSIAMQRITYRPNPHQVANELFSSDKNEKTTGRELRKLTRENGSAFGILVILYNKPNPQDVFRFFENEDFKKSLQDNGYKVPSPKREQDLMMVNRICNILTIKSSGELMASPYPEHYRAVLEILKQNGYLKNQEGNNAYGFQQTTDIALPKAIFLGGDESAQELAAKELKDPKRTEYIVDHYGNRLTSIVATAFIEKLE